MNKFTTLLLLALVGTVQGISCYTYSKGVVASGSDSSNPTTCPTSSTSCIRWSGQGGGVEMATGGCAGGTGLTDCDSIKTLQAGVAGSFQCATCDTDNCNSGSATAPALSLLGAVAAALYALM